MRKYKLSMLHSLSTKEIATTPSNEHQLIFLTDHKLCKFGVEFLLLRHGLGWRECVDGHGAGLVDHAVRDFGRLGALEASAPAATPLEGSSASARHRWLDRPPRGGQSLRQPPGGRTRFGQAQAKRRAGTWPRLKQNMHGISQIVIGEKKSEIGLLGLGREFNTCLRWLLEF